MRLAVEKKRLIMSHGRVNFVLVSRFGRFPPESTGLPPFLTAFTIPFLHFEAYLSCKKRKHFGFNIDGVYLRANCHLKSRSEFNLTPASLVCSSLPKASFCASRDSNGSTWLTTGRQMAVMVKADPDQRPPRSRQIPIAPCSDSFPRIPAVS